MSKILTSREVATILHGLRIVQSGGRPEGCAVGNCKHFIELSPLNHREIDELCEKISVDLEIDTERRYTNNYLCPADATRWDTESDCMHMDHCPNCGTQVEPYASIDKRKGDVQLIHNKAVYDNANVIDKEDLATVCTSCHETNLLNKKLNIKSQACQACHKVGTLIPQAEYNKLPPQRRRQA